MAKASSAVITTAADFARAFDVSRETLAAFETYERSLRRWQNTINLVAPGSLDAVWHRHFADSVQLLKLAPPSAVAWVDLGSGGGFPGLALAILLKERPDARMTLVESDTRKAAFLREVARAVSAPVDILCMRIEKAATQVRISKVDVVTARALAPLPRLLDLCRPFFSPGTVALLPKGKDAEHEVAEARRHWSFGSTLEPSLTDTEARIVIVRDLKPKREE